MQKLWIASAPTGWQEGLSLLTEDLHFTLDPAGLPLTAELSDHLAVRFDGAAAVISCREKAHFFRGAALLLHALAQGKPAFYLEETPGFERTGAMFDVSRNAVLRPESVRLLLRKMACMGLNAAMLYTEDTYEIPGYPYFGYMRGAYTAQELKDLDDYADALGIELIPCIQTLGHLKNALRWSKMQPLADTASVLLCDDEEVYRFIGAAVASITGCLRSKKIHVGMDEAMDLGLGNHLRKHGYEDGFSIIRRHLDRVMEILRRHGLRPMMWSDMYFRLASASGHYYDLDGAVPQSVIDAAPKDMDLVYWDYYHEDEGFYKEYIRRHKEFPGRVVFAGGLWTWSTLTVHNGHAFRTSIPALRQCREQGVDEVYATVWGDDGAECSQIASLLGLQLYAEYTFASDVSMELLKDRFAACTGENMDAFLALSRMDVLEDAAPGDPLPPDESYATRELLYTDPLLDLYAENYKAYDLRDHYRKLAGELAAYAAQSPSCAVIFRAASVLAELMADKCVIARNLRSAYAAKDRETLERLAKTDLPALIRKTEALRAAWRELWFTFNKPFGYELLDVRFGGIAARLETAAVRMTDYLEGRVPGIEELEAEHLPMDSVYYWSGAISASTTIG